MKRLFVLCCICFLGMQNSFLIAQHTDTIPSLQKMELYKLVTCGKFKQTEKYLLKELNSVKKNLGEDNKEYLHILESLGHLYYHKGDLMSAEQYYTQALESIGNKNEDYKETYASLLGGLSSVYADRMDYNSAIVYMTQALEIIKELYGDNHIEYAGLLKDLGTIYHNMSAYDKAEHSYKKALKIYKFLGEDTPSYAITLHCYGQFLLDRGDLLKSKKYFLQALEMQKSLLGEEHKDYLITLSSLADLDVANNDLISAEEKYKQIQNTQKRLYGGYNIDYASTLMGLGNISLFKRDYKEAKKYYIEAANLISDILGEEHTFYVATQTALGDVLFEEGDLINAEIYYIKSLLITKKTLGEEHLLYADKLLSLVYLNHAKGDISTAIHYLNDVLKLKEKKLGEEHIDYIHNLLELGVIYYQAGNYLLAESTLLNALELYERKTEKSIDYALCLQNLGLLYIDINDYDKAEKYLLKSLSVCDKNDELHIALLNDIANLYSEKGDIEKAKKYFVEVLSSEDRTKANTAYAYMRLGDLESQFNNISETESYYTKALEFEDAPTMQLELLEKLGFIYSKQNKFREAEKSILKAINLNKKLENNQEVYVRLIGCLATTLSMQGNFDESEKLLLESLNIYEKKLGTEKEGYIDVLCGLGNISLALQNFNIAEQYILKAVEVAQNIEDYNNESYSVLLHALSTFYYSTGNYNMAERYALQAYYNLKEGEIETSSLVNVLDLLGQLYNAQNQLVSSEKYLLESLDVALLKGYKSANTRINLAVVYLKQHKYDLSEKYFIEALDITKDTYGVETPFYANSLKNAGVYYFIRGERDKARNYLLQAQKPIKKYFDKSHVNYGEMQYMLGCIDLLDANYKSAIKYLNQANMVYQNLFIHSIDYMTETQRNQYLQSLQFFFDGEIPNMTYLIHSSNPSISTFAYDNELFRKGLLLASSNEVRNSILKSGDSVLINQWNELSEYKKDILCLEENDFQNPLLEEYRHHADSLEKIMTVSSAAFRENKERWSITWENVRKKLSDSEVAIEYFSAPINKDSTMYCALLLRNDSKYPELIPLFEEKEIASLLTMPEKNASNLYDYYALGKHVSQVIWGKILPNLQNVETIYFAPSGVLHQLAIEYLPYNEDQTLSDVYNIVRLSSTREIVYNKQTQKYSTASVYGGILYDVENQVLTKESNNYHIDNMLASRGIENDTLNRGTVSYLPGTLEEAKYINSLLQENNISVTLYSAERANEESFKSLSGKHNNILHIGTHGFTWTDSIAKKQDYFESRMLSLLDRDQPRGPIIDPLNRCGLLFAGANTALQGNSKQLPEGVQDGILTAKEISLLDLSETTVVVLSACETAKGDITSEGVFGLQRAFKMAGVQTLIMSLWQVNDRATQMLMTEFFDNWINKKQSKREAFKNAQQTVRKEYEEPYYWAAFVMLD